MSNRKYLRTQPTILPRSSLAAGILGSSLWCSSLRSRSANSLVRMKEMKGGESSWNVKNLSVQSGSWTCSRILRSVILDIWTNLLFRLLRSLCLQRQKILHERRKSNNVEGIQKRTRQRISRCCWTHRTSRKRRRRIIQCSFSKNFFIFLLFLKS